MFKAEKSPAKDNITIAKLLIIQLIAFSIVSLTLYFVEPFWSIVSLCGGLTAWLPNILFILVTQHHLTSSAIPSAISWSFTLGWLLKFIVTIILLVVTIQGFNADFIPLGLGFLSVIVMQFLAPIIASVFRN